MSVPARQPSPDVIRACLALRKRKPQIREGYRRAAVLFPLVRTDAGYDVLLTRRTGDLPHHRGQIAFPGGSVDEGESCEMTALRETEEEISLERARVELLGCMDDIWTPSGFIIAPVVGLIDGTHALKPNPAEVSRIFFVPLSFFADERNAERQLFEFEQREREVFFYRYDGETIWGATALMIRNFLQQVGMIPGQHALQQEA